jgi:hypothetical protein
MKQTILIAILLVVVVIVLLRTVLKAAGWLRGSAVWSVEGFASPTAVNTTTVCPAGTTMYMYGGVAYCCDGRINRDAPTLAGSCRAATSAPGARPVFCSLGAGSDGVPNCLEIHGQQLAEEGVATCPSSMPNYVKGPSGSATEKGRCCAGPANADQTDCFSTAPGTFCDAARADNEFAGGPASCEFQRAKELEGASCPSGWGAFTQPGQGALAGLTVFGCSDNNQMCYSAATTARLQELGYDTTAMSVCKAN